MTSLRFAFVMLLVAMPGESAEVDDRGYVVFCPCMGRFGNQADQFLGALKFAKELDRTLVLPHWVEYHKNGVPGSMQIPFDKYFKVEPLLNYHRVILMEEFMDELSSLVWPAGNRTVFCYRARDMSMSAKANSCNAKDGNPFGPFWDAFGVDFDHDEFFGPLLWKDSDMAAWRQRYPADRWPVLAFTGAPAEFPVSVTNAMLHKHLTWTDSMTDQALAVVNKHLQRPFIGAHLRIGSDWFSACRHVKEGRRQHLFSSPQCLGASFENGVLTKEMCLPSAEVTVNQLVFLVNKVKAKSVFLARDSPQYDQQITAALDKLSNKTYQVKVYWQSKDNPHLDLVLLAMSDHYVGNCVSSFSAFAARERRSRGLDVSFWAFSPQTKDEL